MRKLSVFESITLDGYFTGDNGDLGWAHRREKPDPKWDQFIAGNASGGGALVFGRVTYEMMVAYWPTEQAAKNDAKIAVALGKGRTLFEGMGGTVGLTPTETRSFDNGNVVLTYSAN